MTLPARLRTLPEALADAARGPGGYVFVDGRHERTRSYAQIAAAARLWAEAYRAHGLQRGDLVALLVSDAEQFLTALLGASIAGLVPASLHPPAAGADRPPSLDATAAILRAARALAIVTTPSLVQAMEKLREWCPDVACVMAGCDGTVANGTPQVTVPGRELPPSLDDLAFVQFTSGSTSRPKGVAITHRNLAANIDAINGPAGLDLSAADSGVSWLPLHHDMGLVGMALGALYAGRPMTLMTPATFVKRPIEWLRAIARQRATVSFAPQFGYDLCLRRVKPPDLVGLDLSCWRVAGCGAEPIHAATLDAFAAAFAPAGFRAASFLPSYGLAEHVLAATFAPRGRGLRVERRSGADLVSCGSPLPGHQLRIIDEAGDVAPDGAVGEIVLAGPSVMQGYYADAARTAETVRGGWLFTGDLGYVSGGELFVCGRTKETIIVNGRKHHAQDLERAVEDLAGLRPYHVVAFAVSTAGSPDRVVMVAERGAAVDAAALVYAIRHRVSDVCGLFVDDIVFVAHGTIGRTTSGKLQRAAMKARYEAGDFA